MRAGVIGCGGMGTTHLRALKALQEIRGIEVEAVADIRKECVERAIGIWPKAHSYETGMELIQKERLDWVHICLPSYLHAEYAIAVMEAGMDVFIEKPVCLTEMEAKKLLEVQKKTGRTVMVGHVVRWFSAYEYLKEIYKKGTYGKLKSIVMNRVGGHPTKGFENWFLDFHKSGGVMMDLHIHDLDFLRYLLGEPESKKIKATSFENGTPNQMVAMYEFGDVWACVEACWDISSTLKFGSAFRASFEQASVIYDSHQEYPLTVYPMEGKPIHIKEKIAFSEEEIKTEINVSDIAPYCAEDDYFITCLQEGKEPEKASLSEAIVSAMITREELEEVVDK